MRFFAAIAAIAVTALLFLGADAGVSWFMQSHALDWLVASKWTVPVSMAICLAGAYIAIFAGARARKRPH